MDLPPTVPPPPGSYPAPRAVPRRVRQAALVLLGLAVVAIPATLSVHVADRNGIEVDQRRLEVVRNRLESVRPMLEGLTDPPGARGQGTRSIQFDCAIHKGDRVGQPGARIGWNTEPGAAPAAAADLQAQIDSFGLSSQDGSIQFRVHAQDRPGADKVTVDVRVRGPEPCTKDD